MQYLGNNLRHEMKYYINRNTYFILKNRMKSILQPDENMINEGGYLISSLYFDDIYHTALKEKQSGICYRKKFRIRCYNQRDQLIKLECKQKFGEYISKISALLSRYEYDSILAEEYDFLIRREEPVCQKLFAYHKKNLLKPVVSVEYLREAYILKEGNVRITFDKNISASVNNYNIFSKDYVTRNVIENNVMVLEVKYDEFIPSFILDMLKIGMANQCAISKYVMCRENTGRVLYR